MVSESVIFTLLPNGIDRDSGDLRSTIYVSPRLRTGGGRRPLDDFPSFRHWPKLLSELTFATEIDGFGKVPLTRDPTRVGAADPDVWDLLFGGDIGVEEPVVKDLGTRRLHSYPADMVAQHVLSLYSEVGSTHPTEHPSVTTPVLTGLAQDLGRIGDHPQETEKLLDGWFRAENGSNDQNRRGRYVPPSAATASRFTSFLLANRFYDRYRGDDRIRDRRGLANVLPRPPRPFLDFHRYVAALGDYPLLLRRLGLAVDVRMPAEPAIANQQRYRVIVDGAAPDWMNAPAATPWMNYAWYDGVFFLPLARKNGRSDIRDGQLMLNSDWYAIHQIDIDGSALKTTHTASTITRRLNLLNGQGATMAPSSSSLPALRGAGLTVVRRNAAAAVVGQFDATAQHAEAERQGKRTELWVDDVVRGYRYDIERDGDGRFRSLVQRVGTYRYHRPDGTVVPLDIPGDEGYVKGSSTTGVPGDQDLYLHEAIASWSGWSMVTPRPGGGVTTDDEPDRGQTPLEQNPDALDEGLPLETVFKAAPKSLPPLRYGSVYRLRARTVDLAGNSVDSDTIDDRHASSATLFKRWEPVPAPAVVARRTMTDPDGNAKAAYGEGESQLRMVIRSTAGMTVTDYLAQSRVEALSSGNATGLPYLAIDERWIVAPKTSQQMAEYHGVFDEAIGSGDPAKIQAAFEIACRESGQLPPFAPDATLSIPYLPDVSSRGVRFNRFFLDPEVYRRIDWPSDTGQWWDRQPIRVVVSSGPGPGPVTPAGSYTYPMWDPATRALTVYVPQAEMQTVRISSAVDNVDLKVQGMFEPILNRTLPADRATRRHEALESRNWMLTPWVELTFVHAVERPLADPVIAIDNTGMRRNSGETFCVLQGAITNHAKSTGRLDIESRWSEQFDDLAEDLPRDGVHAPLRPELFSHVGDFDLEAFENDCLVGRDDHTTPTGKGNTHRLRHEFGNTRHRVVRYHARATTRFREYFPPAVINGTAADGTSLIARRGPEKTLIVPSSRRPDPPDIAYVIPTFRWTDGTVPMPTGGSPGALPGIKFAQQRTRHGGLRVYLRRPWFSSGDGEQLGVVLQDQPWLTWPVDQRAGLQVLSADQLRAEGFLAAVAGRGRVKLDGAQSLPIAERFLRGVGVSAAQLAGIGKVELTSGDLPGFDGIAALLGQPELVTLLGNSGATWLTRMGADPAFGSATVPVGGPYIHQFPLRRSVQGGVSLSEAPKVTVTVVGHTPKFDPERKLWFCDVDLTPGASYQPFVRLALCRYQPQSIDGCHISRVVRADFAQVPPVRTATVTPLAAGRTSVSLRGPSGFGVMGADRAPVDRLSLTRSVTATVQRLETGGDPDLGWATTGEPVELKAGVGAAGLADVTWSGFVPDFTRQAGFAYRLLLREFEIHPTDRGDTEDPFGQQSDVSEGHEMSEEHWRSRRRLVYADTFTL